MKTDIQISAVYDRDYWCDEEIAEIQTNLEKDIYFCHIHSYKEIENYLLHPDVLSRSVDKAIVEREKRNGIKISRDESVMDIIEKISSSSKSSLLGQYISKYSEYHRPKGKDQATLNTEALHIFDSKWDDLFTRMTIVGGKDFLSTFRTYIDNKWGISLTDTKIIDEYKLVEIPTDLVDLIKKIEAYRTLVSV